MIEWKLIDKNNPPEGTKLFIFNEIIFEGWTTDEEDDEGYPMWQANEGRSARYDVRWYADINYPNP